VQGFCSVTDGEWQQCRVCVVLLMVTGNSGAPVLLKVAGNNASSPLLKPVGNNAGSLLLKLAGNSAISVYQNSNVVYQVHRCKSTFYFALSVAHPRCAPINRYIYVLQ
jgi:hypothetical protein